MRGEEAQGVVAPVVRGVPAGQRRLAGEGVHRQQLDGGHAQPGQVLDGRRVRQARVGAAQVVRDAGVQPGQPAHVRLVDHGLRPRHGRRAVVAPVEAVVQQHAAGHERRGVVRVADVGVPGQVVADHVPEHLGPPGHLAGDAPGVRVEQQLVRVVAQAARRLPGPVRAKAVRRPRGEPGHEPEVHPVHPLGQLDPPLGRAGAGPVEDAQLDGFGVRCVHRDVRADLARAVRAQPRTQPAVASPRPASAWSPAQVWRTSPGIAARVPVLAQSCR